MNNHSPNEKLDIVLNFIKEKSIRPRPTIAVIAKFCADIFGSNEIEAIQIVDKLVKDQFVECEFVTEIIGMDRDNNEKSIVQKYYYITFEGSLYYGYQFSLKTERINLRYKKVTLILLNIASFLAGTYYGSEMIRIYILPIFQHVCACQFVWQK